jgi:hypothetical protein
MGQGVARHLRAGTCTFRRTACSLALVALMAPGVVVSASAQVAINALRTSALYSGGASTDCSALHMKDDPNLPFNVVRLHASPPASGSLHYHWSMRKSDEGMLIADQDLGPGGTTPAVSGMCSDFGSACVLTPDKLGFYDQDTILWIAPTCAVLPNKTKKPFRGGMSRVSVKVTDGRRKVGHATLSLAWGMDGATTLFVEDMRGRFQDGVKGPNPVVTFANPIFAWTVTPPSPAPAGSQTAQFTGGTAVNGACSLAGFAGCTEVDFPAAGPFLVQLTLQYPDGSALCDKLDIRVAACVPDARLDVIPKPKRSTYDPANPAQNPVEVTVRLRNASKPSHGLPGCPFLLRGANILACSGSLKVGNLTESASTSFDLQHCSLTKTQGCQTNADCRQSNCDTCQPSEVCLTQPHCSTTFTHPCGNNADCEGPGPTAACPNCQPNETCVHILAIGNGTEVFLEPGQSIDLLNQPFTLRNTLPDTAKITDTWTAAILIPPDSASRTLKYKIRGRP